MNQSVLGFSVLARLLPAYSLETRKAQMEEAWENARRVSQEYDIRGLRQDSHGNWIKRYDYQDENSAFGWRSHPVFRGGGIHLEPLHWRQHTPNVKAPSAVRRLLRRLFSRS